MTTPLLLVGFLVLVIALLLAGEKVVVLNPANPLAILFFLVSISISLFFWCREWIATRVKMMNAKFKRTRFNIHSSPSTLEGNFNVTY